ncbi:MAG: cytochrome C biogenesis protein CcdA [Armatimonadetes bacterium]|nr:cytochrome C biogenesis protein CcdA [Armatimonadota bacterium]
MKRAGTPILVFLFVLLTLGTRSVLARAIDDQIRDVASQLMCPVCEGRTVAESNSQLATQMRDLIRQRLLAGDRPETIIRYFVERYGESALATPPTTGLGVLMWLLPAAGVAAGVAWVRARVRVGTPRAWEDDVAPLSPGDLERLRRGLDEAR